MRKIVSKFKKFKKRVSLLEGVDIQRRPVNSKLVTSVSAFPFFPEFYEDSEFKCKDCGNYSIWSAEDQKWWHETMKKPLEIIAVRCTACRQNRRSEKALQKEHMREMAKKAPHPNETFFKNT